MPTWSSSKLIVILLIWAGQNWPYLFFFLLALGITVVLPSLHETLHCKKQSNPSPSDKKTSWQKLFLMIQSVGTKNWIPLSINRPQRFTLLFLYLTHLFWFVQQNEICMMRIKTQSFTWPAKYWWNFVDSITKSCIYNPIKSLWWSFFCKNS